MDRAERLERAALNITKTEERIERQKHVALEGCQPLNRQLAGYL